MPLRECYQPGEFCWIDLNSHQLSGAKQFYQALFGWTAIDFDTQGGPPYAGFFLGEHNIGGVGEMDAAMKAQGMPPLWNCYLSVADADATVARAQQLGGTVVVPVMQVLDAGRLAFIADPTGAVFGIWQPQRMAGVQAWGDAFTPCWCELATRDIEAARTFYEGLVGWKCNEFPDVPSKYYVANVGSEMTGGLMRMTADWGDAPSHWSVYFHVPDVDATVAKCTALGGKTCVPPFDASVGRIAGCQDNQGAFFYLIKMNLPA